MLHQIEVSTNHLKLLLEDMDGELHNIGQDAIKGENDDIHLRLSYLQDCVVRLTQQLLPKEAR